MLRTLLIIATLFSAACCGAQASSPRWTLRSFQVADGLPANNTTALIIDNRGFLWIGSENGLARFDGNRFRTFNAEQGLPDNEIRALSLDPGGHLIAWTYRNAAAVFDEHSNTFHAVPSAAPENPASLQLRGSAYTCDSFSLVKTGAQGRLTRRLPFSPARLGYSGRHPVLISENGIAAALVDTQTLTTTLLPLDGALAREVLEDAQGTIWITTAGQGLIRLSVLPVISYRNLLPTDMAPAVVATSGDALVCGDDKGRIAFFRHGCLEALINIARWSRAVSRIRAILPLPDGYYVAVEGDASLRLDKSYQVVSVYNRPWLNYTDRCAALWQDSIVLAGGHDRTVRLNLRSCAAGDTAMLRSTAIAADAQGRLLIGTAGGLYRQDDTGLFCFGTRVPALGGRITDICRSPDGLIWMGLSTPVLLVLDGEQLVEAIALNRAMPGNGVNSLCNGRPGELWIGTDRGATRLRYAYRNGALERRATAFGMMDGLPGQIADLAWHADTLYAASSGGLFALPGATEPRVSDVPVFITAIRINDHDTVLNEKWSVPHDLNDWTIHFSGIDPAGSDPVFLYSINGEPWQETVGDVLSLKQLAPGSYRIHICAVRRDGRLSAGEARLLVHIAAPFWKTAWFWVLLFVVLLGAAIVLLQLLFRSRRARQLKRLQTEHALATSQQQTFSALMNPHFIFNALNSIQHYVLKQDKLQANRYLSGFGRLIRMNFESAQQSVIPLDEELSRLRLYLELEQMRFGNKLHWEIAVEPGLDTGQHQIPAMILQPFLENALMHGIAPAKGPGELKLEILRAAGHLLIRIRDNGIGMANSKRLRSGNGHKSQGMELIRRRLELLGRLHGKRIGLRFSDADPANPGHPGTVVELLIPELPA